MPNTYRVDRVDSPRVPCGMNSIVHIGDDWYKARAAFHATAPGKDEWNQPNAAYGVTLAVWCGTKRDYIIKCQKGLS